MDNYNQSVSVFLKAVVKQFDGLVWLVCSILSILLAILINTNLIPSISEDFGKKTIILLFIPIILFAALLNLRQLPFSNKEYSSLIRVILILLLFVYLVSI